MAMAWSGRWFLGLCCCLLLFLASASVVPEQSLHGTLLEVGHLWLQAVVTVWGRALEFATTVPDPYDWKSYVYLGAVLAGAYGGYAFFLRPLNRVRKLGDIGYIAEGSFSARETANQVQRRRKVGKVPPVYPNGWFGIMESFLLRTGQVTSVSMLGQNLAVFRDERGTAHALDAYCPHMGANLAVGGRVLGKCLECPFHGWKFRGEDGKCISIPYADKVPDTAKVKSWPVVEMNGWIYLWHHADGIDPTWQLPEIEEITKGDWVYRGRTEHMVNAHIEEIPENGADVTHLGQVHGPIFAAGIDLRYMWTKKWSFAQHHWTAAWEALPEPEAHVGKLQLTHSLSLFGLRLPFLDLSVNARQIGPGVVYMKFESMLGRGVYIQSLTPIEPMVQKMVHNIYVNWTMPIPISKFYMLAEAIQVERDLMIWNNKQYEGKPLFVKSKEDSLISRHRRWYSQFYSENSPRLHFQKDSMEW